MTCKIELDKVLGQQPVARDRRHPADYRDDIEHAEVARILSEPSAEVR